MRQTVGPITQFVFGRVNSKQFNNANRNGNGDRISVPVLFFVLGSPKEICSREDW